MFYVHHESNEVENRLEVSMIRVQILESMHGKRVT